MMNAKAVPSFGKYPVMKCRVKQYDTNQHINATLFRLDTDCKNDLFDVRRSKNTNCIKDAFTRAFAMGDKLNEYYVLQDNATSEVISCSQVVRKYRPYTAENPGFSTLIRTMSENKKYNFGLEPMLAYITRLALNRGDSSVYAPYNKYDSESWSEWSPYELPSLQDLRVKDAGKDGICIPAKGFYHFIDKAVRNRRINFLV